MAKNKLPFVEGASIHNAPRLKKCGR